MKVLLVRANPRKTGYTQRLLAWFLQGLRESGAELADVDLTRLTITPCDGCYRCWLATPGQCVHRDDMPGLLQQILAADVLVCVTPIYYYSMSSCLKIFFERMIPLAKPGVVAPQGGFTHNRIRYPEQWKGKKLITLVAGALREPELYRPANEVFQLIADGLELELAGQLTRPESYWLDYPLSKPMTLKRVEAAFIQAGREAGRSGRLSSETVAAAGAPLAESVQHFCAYSNIYWERAAEMGPRAVALAEVQKRVGGDVRILLREMVRCVDAKATARIKAVLQFDFPDKHLCFHVAIDSGQAALTEGTTSNPDLRVRCASETWAAVFTLQLDVRQALKNRQILLAGDKSLFARLNRFFPPPST
jgi:putative NADPH-quinone reductase/putative sterol carrier protein